MSDVPSDFLRVWSSCSGAVSREIDVRPLAKPLPARVIGMEDGFHATGSRAGSGADGSEGPLDHRPALTARECHVLELIAEGLSTRQIATTLFVTEQAVTYHVGNLLSKFGCGNRAGIVARAYVLGFLDHRSWPPRLTPSHQGSPLAGEQPIDIE